MSRKTIGTLTAAEMLAEIDAAEAKLPDRDSEWKTTKEWAKFLNLSRQMTSEKLSNAVQSGLMEVRKEPIHSPIRGVYRTQVYRWKTQSQPVPKSAKRSRS